MRRAEVRQGLAKTLLRTCSLCVSDGVLLLTGFVGAFHHSELMSLGVAGLNVNADLRVDVND